MRTVLAKLKDPKMMEVKIMDTRMKEPKLIEPDREAPSERARMAQNLTPSVKNKCESCFLE